MRIQTPPKQLRRGRDVGKANGLQTVKKSAKQDGKPVNLAAEFDIPARLGKFAGKSKIASVPWLAYLFVFAGFAGALTPPKQLRRSGKLKRRAEQKPNRRSLPAKGAVPALNFAKAVSKSANLFLARKTSEGAARVCLKIP